MTRDLVSHRKSSYKYIRNRQGPRWPQGACHTGDLPSVPGAANSQTTRVLDQAVATDNAVEVPKHVGALQLLGEPTLEIHIQLQEVGGNPAPAAKTTLTQTLLHHSRLT